MDGESQHAERGADLVVVGLPGVQRFIEEARSTGDVAAASGIYSRLAGEVVGSLRAEAGADLILPAAEGEKRDERGMPNRVVALLPSGTGPAAAVRAAAAADEAWRRWIRAVWQLPDGAEAPGTPGFPVLHWVCVPAGSGGYAEQWRRAQRLLAARRRVRDFPAAPEEEWRQRALCSLSPRWPAEPKAPPHTPRHDQDARLSVVGWVKRRWARLNDAEGFPSTSSIASAGYRRAVLEHLADEDVGRALDSLERAGRVLGTAPETAVPGLMIPESGPGLWLGVRGGPWVYPGRWQPASLAREVEPREDLAQVADAGQRAASDLARAMKRLGFHLPAYLAVVVQDLDSMGQFLSGGAPDASGGKISISPNEHRRLSTAMLGVAAGQRSVLVAPDLLGVPVYAGGDDLLAFTPAASALRAAQACHEVIPSSLPRASTAVLYFHHYASIQRAMGEARRLLDAAKGAVPGKHGLAVGYLRRSGASALSIQPWAGPDGGSSAGLFGIFAREQARLSPRLVADLDRDAGELAALAQAYGSLYRAELARLVRRHCEDAADQADAARAAEALEWLGGHEYAPDGIPGPHAAAQVGVFLRQEAR